MVILRARIFQQVYWSGASNLVAQDTNSVGDVFVTNRATQSTKRVNATAAILQANGESGFCTISADGNTVVFESAATNLDIGDLNNQDDIFESLLACTGQAYCEGDATGSSCPCDPGQAGALGQGCGNSTGSGALLCASGDSSVSADTSTLSGSGLPPTGFGLFFQGTIQQGGGQGAWLGDGLLCVNGIIRRLGTRHAAAGVVSLGFGIAGDQLIDALGAIPAAGGTRYYQLWYRDPAAFCTTSTFNLTNGLRVDWVP
jgi:hypothetical protein